MEKKEILQSLNEGNEVDLVLFKENFKLAFDPRQRLLNPTHVGNLKKAIQKDGTVIKPIEVVPALRLLEEDETLYVAKEDAMLDRLTEDIDSYFVVIDGDHRLAAIEAIERDKGKEGDVEHVVCKVVVPQIPQGMTCRTYQDRINNARKGWDSRDRMTSMAVKYRVDDNTVAGLMIKWKAEYGFSYRESYCLCHLRDRYKKQMVVESQEGDTIDQNLIGTPQNVERGKRLCEALLIGCRTNPRIAQSLAPAQAITSVYDNIDDEHKAEGVCNIILALKCMTEDDAASIAACNSIPEKAKRFESVVKEKMLQMQDEDMRREMETIAEQHQVEYSTPKPTVKKEPKPKVVSKKAIIDTLKSTYEYAPRFIVDAVFGLTERQQLEVMETFVNYLHEQGVSLPKSERKKSEKGATKKLLEEKWEQYCNRE